MDKILLLPPRYNSSYCSGSFSIVCSLAIFSLYEFPFARSKRDKIEDMIELVGLKPDMTVVDLGFGDGSVLIAAAEWGRAV